MLTDCVLQPDIAKSKTSQHGAAHTENVCLFFCISSRYCSPVSGHLHSSLKSCLWELPWLHPRQHCQVADWNALIGVWLVPAKDMCLLPPNFYCQSHNSGTAETFFPPHLWFWHSRMVNTSLWQRGAIGAGTRSDHFKGSAGHNEMQPSPSYPKWVSQTWYYIAHLLSLPRVFFFFFLFFCWRGVEVLFMFLIGPLSSHFAKCFICHLHSAIVLPFNFPPIYVVLHTANHTCCSHHMTTSLSLITPPPPRPTQNGSPKTNSVRDQMYRWRVEINFLQITFPM